MTNAYGSFNVEEHPTSMLWVAVPPILLVSAYFIRRWYKGYMLRTYGIGRGAKGFQTSVAKVRITPEIAERIRRGEEVSPQEIEEASKRLDELEKSGKAPATPKRPAPPPQVWEDEKPFVDSRTPREPSPVRKPSVATRRTTRSVSRQQMNEGKEPEVNEWLPENITQSTKKRRGRKA